MTRCAVPAPGFTFAPVEVELGGWFGGTKLLQNGEPAAKGSKRGAFTLRRDDGSEVSARLRPEALGIDPIPGVEIDGRKYALAKPFAWYEMVWLGLPVLLVFQGGALGAIVGIMTMSANARVFRSPRPAIVRYGLTLGITVLGVIAFVILAILILSAVGPS